MSRYHQRIRPVWAEIDLAAIRHNMGAIKKLVGPAVEVMAVVKAEAYGHGAVPVARAALEAGATWLGVSLPEEGVALRQAGLDAPILIFSPLQADQAPEVVAHDLTPCVCWLEAVTALSGEAVRAGKEAAVHVKVDTGMGRVGVRPGEAAEFIGALRRMPGIKVGGVFSHLATADERDKSYARLQIDNFTRMAAELEQQGLLPPKAHLANSAGVMELPQAYFNLVRPGIIMYGLYPSDEVDKSKIRLEPAFSLKAQISFVKRVPSGTGISYGQRYHTGRETTIATIPIGYADGWTRLLTHKAQALVNGKKYPIVGTICMDQCMIDVGDEPVAIGQEVVLIGTQNGATISVDDVAAQLGTINYEIICMISDRVPRIYRDGSSDAQN
ncbi:alanine racemase [Hydrogenispora ethanolica]|uniref:Alanine racemase n=1 Tax=Hydrogenispora ethanolica TaxID=1082276 RepID=A0A4R1R8Y3_HYDET|nr:alanine racemase [Hydrogenispora ethanolica]TCL61842.1 alanine racemase [Hydrogenispora ethanolica]